MDRSDWNYVVDVGALVSFLICFVTGVIKIRSIGKYFSYLDFRLISRIHDYSGLVLGLLVIVHVLLHWNWLKEKTRTLFES
mgnify:CR=1 FL=1